MKTSILAVAASALLASSVDARIARRNAHANAHAHFDIVERGAEVCPPKPCTTYVTGVWVEYQAPHTPPPYSSTATVQSTAYVTPLEHKPETTVCSTTIPFTYSAPVPTPEVTTCPTPGTYTIPAKTVTLTSSETVCVPTTTVCSTPGVYTVGTSTTVVTCSTTVTCPYATISTASGTAYTTIATTTLVCPSAGTYTYGGVPTTVTTSAYTCEYPAVTVYTPAVYTQPCTTVTVVSTDYVVTCPYATYVTPAPAPPKKTTTYAPAPVYSSAPAVVYTAAAKSSTSSAAVSTSTSTSYNNIGGVGNQWCITYSPYNDDTSCKSASAIQADIADIASKGFHSIRLYSADCGALEAVGSACELHGLKIVLGIFIKEGGAPTAQNDLTEIISWAKWELVEMMVIGNEAIFNGWISATDLASFIVSCKAQLSAAGCNVPITTSETLNILQANPGLCNVIDVVAVNIHPFFNSGVTAAEAGTFLLGQMKLAESVCSKTAYCLEAGWPSAGLPNGAAVPGTAEQKQALEAIYAVDMGRIAYFTYTNDGWKTPGAYDVEQNFGCVNVFPMSSY